MMASAPLTMEIADALERVVATGNRRNRNSREWAESEAEYCEALAGLRPLFGYGDWLPFVKERGWPYDDVSRCLRFHKLGGTPELLQEHRMTGSLALLSEQHRAAKMEAAPTPEPGPDPASEEDDQFCNSAKLAPPPETPPGAGDAPAPEEDEGGAGGASDEAAAEPEAERREDGPEVPPVWPWSLDNLDMKFSGDRMLLCLLAEDMKTLQERAILAVLAYCNGFDKESGKQVPCTVMPLDRLAAIARKDVRTVQGWLMKARSAGWLHSDPQGRDRTDAQYVWPHMPPGMRQGSLPLMRTFDRTHRASAAEAAESAAARPKGETPFTPGVKPASPRGESPVAHEVRRGSPLTGKETGIETGGGTLVRGSGTPEPGSPHPPDAIQAFGIWNEVAAETGMRPAVELDADRAAKLTARVRDAGGLGEFRAVCERAGGSKALTGRKPGSWAADLDQFLEPKFFRRVREGGWDDAPSEPDRFDQAHKDAAPDPEELRAEVLMSPLADDAPGFVAALCDRLGAGWVRSWLKDCRLEWRGDSDAALLFTNGFSQGRVDRDYRDTFRDLWRELHGGELVLETRRAA